MGTRICKTAPPTWKEPAADRVEISLTLKTITPMFGGSAIPREVDKDNPIRAASIRGHLRFWWRATAGAKYASAEDLFAAESVLWGRSARTLKDDSGWSKADPDAYSQVMVRVEILDSGTSQPFASIAPGVDPQKEPREGFFLFPFDEIKAEGKSAVPGIVGIRFRLILSFPAPVRGKVVRAIRAWLAFGGVGARTRRGLGALTVESSEGCNPKDWLPPVTGFDAWLKELAGTDAPAEMPPQTRLAGGFAFLGGTKNAMACWRELGSFWAKFRKGHYIQRDKSKWGSEWNDHRILTAIQSDHQAQSAELSKPYFGLPIVYQDFSKNDPKFRGKFHGTLEAKASTGKRMASPIVLKPVAFADGTFRPMVLLLRTPLPKVISIGERELTLRKPQGDPVLAAARRKGFQEVKL